MDAIVLVGGLGTRLRSVVNDIPKPMALINGIPFLEYLLQFLTKQQVNRIILCVGYKGDKIKDYFGNCYNGAELIYSYEDEPLGTGGAIKRALSKVRSKNVFVLNGDTYFNIDLLNLKKIAAHTQCDIVMTIKPMSKFDRYGSVKLKSNKVIGFEEKKFVENGKINGGIYCIDSNIFSKIISNDNKFSFEKDFLEKHIGILDVKAYVSDSYFIDIGVPEDYERAQLELRKNI